MTNVVQFPRKRISEIAVLILKLWPKISPYAKPYLKAMLTLDEVEDVYILDTAESIVLRFLANAEGWRGDNARRIKSELRHMLKNINRERADNNHKEVYRK